MTDQPIELLTFALLYAEQGWPVIPLHTPVNGLCSCGRQDCTHIGKHPRIRDWQTKASTNEATIIAWWSKWPDANIGILTGRRSGLLVIDKDDGQLDLADDDLLLPVVSTAKGYHLYHEHPDFDISNRVRFADSTDLRAEGGLVVAPPSLHASGKRYTWITSFTLPLTLPPAELLAKLSSDDQDAPTTHPTPDPSQGGGDNSGYVAAALAGEMAKIRSALEGQRNDQLNKSAFALGTLIGAGELDQHTAETELLAAALATGLTAAEAQKTIASGMQAGIKKPRKIDAPAPPVTIKASTELQIHAWAPATYITDRPAMLPEEFILDCLGEEEYGDAKLLTKLYQGRLCYSTSEKAWYVWGGHAWYRDQWLLIRHLIAGQVARQYLLLASDSDSMTPRDQIKLLATRALKLRTLQRCNNIESFARSFLSITGEEWDRNPWLLGVANGVLDLRTGKLRPGQPTDYIRTVAPTVWRGIDAPAPRFEQFIQEIFDNSEPITGFIQRLLGYSITGLTVEHIFPVLWGERGRNGKDTLLESLKAVLGDCADTVSTDVLLAQNSRGSAQPHLIDLMGKRLVWASETSVNARLNEAQVKLVTGGGTIKARPLYGGMLQFAPTHLVLLITNHKPRANAEDDALWNRIVLLPFNLRFVAHPTEQDERQRDPHLRQKLTEERSGVLAWLVRGCLAWQRDGLNIPDEVRASTDSYREEEDLIGQFIDECCAIHTRAQVKATAFYKAYREWAENAGMNPLNQTNFGNRMKKRFERKRTESGFFYIGIGLLHSDFDPDPPVPSVPMIRKVHEESKDMEGLSAKRDQGIHRGSFPPPGQGKERENSQGAESQGAEGRAEGEGLQNGHSASTPVAQGAGRMRVDQAIEQRRAQVSCARALLKERGTAAELATVDIAGMTDEQRAAFIEQLERRSDASLG